MSSTALVHLSDDELQSLAEGAMPRAEAAAHLALCPQCQAEVASYTQVGEALATLDQPLPPLNFTAAVLERLPTPSPKLAPDDLTAVVLATGAALVAAVLFRSSDGATVLFEIFHRFPGRALSEALIAASLHGHNQVSVLLCLSTAALLLGTPLWRLLSPQRTVA